MTLGEKKVYFSIRWADNFVHFGLFSTHLHFIYIQILSVFLASLSGKGPHFTEHWAWVKFSINNFWDSKFDLELQTHEF